MLIGILLVFGTCYFQNCRGTKDNNPTPPAVEKAGYIIKIKVTGRILYTNDVKLASVPDYDTTKGYKIYTLSGYWEVVKDKYVYRKNILSLSEKLFGEIIFEKRTDR